MIERYEQQREKQKHEEKESKGTRTKEEILRLRKEMMKPNLIKPRQEESEVSSPRTKDEINNPFAKGKKEPNPELLSRLAAGKKTKVLSLRSKIIGQVDKKEMIALTTKNYELLPEVKKRKEAEKKKEDLKKRQEMVKKLDQVKNKILTF